MSKSSEQCFSEIWRKYKGDPRVFASLKKIGPTFPLPGPHYDYVDLVEHIRYSLLNLCTCDPDELPEYHLPEIFHRRVHLSEKAEEMKARLSEEEYGHYLKHMNELISEWEKDFKVHFSKCLGK
jgi:hypothetical protein